jgi:outer membrane protein OmpA-like peptidoglycan-associated protein
MKTSAKVLLYFDLDCGIMEFFTYKPQSQEKLLTFPHFLEHGSAEKIAVCGHTTRDPNKEDD